MKTNHETGNIKNITHFQELITFCEGFGEKYNPSSEALKIPLLQSLLDEVNHKFSVAKDAKNINRRFITRLQKKEKTHDCTA